MAARTSSTLAASSLCLAAALWLAGCAASGPNAPARAGSSQAQGAQREKWPVLPPPQWVKPGNDDKAPARTNK